MKLLLNIICWVLVAFCFYFPLTYFDSEANRKEIKTKHILLNTEEEAIKVKQEILDKKITFADAAKKYSQCPSKEDFGDIGYNARGNLLPEYEKLAFSADLGKLNDPIKTEAGWHLVKVTEIKYFSDKEGIGKRY